MQPLPLCCGRQKVWVDLVYFVGGRGRYARGAAPSKLMLQVVERGCGGGTACVGGGFLVDDCISICLDILDDSGGECCVWWSVSYALPII